eukprot:6214036-Pleurochrysis_carterae.AAC.2
MHPFCVASYVPRVFVKGLPRQVSQIDRLRASGAPMLVCLCDTDLHVAEAIQQRLTDKAADWS